MANKYYDSNFRAAERLPRKFTVHLSTVDINAQKHTIVSVNGAQVGDIINNNSTVDDGYRFHDVFHFTFAALLSWSPCTRSMLKSKRKSVPAIDEFEDGARATITEEAISLMLFSAAKSNNYFRNNNRVPTSLLNQIMAMTHQFEVRDRAKSDWQSAILKGYELFDLLKSHDGGTVYFDMYNRTASFKK